MSRIKELPKSTSHLLSCTQVITSVQSVVKELLENALDSHATNVEIKLENFGLEKIEVKDNGDGIIKEDIQCVAKPHYTSKITSHLDLIKINTYGFRGEALAAICAVADLGITTKTADEEFGYTYTFDHSGNILSSKPCPCNQGTSVVVTNLFNNMPVRKQLYRSEKKKKEDLRIIEDILIAFGCILTRIRFVLYHNQNLVWQKSFVDRRIDGLRLALGEAADYMENCEYADKKTRIKIETFLPKCNAPPSCGQTSSNRSVVAINKRPVRMKNIDKLLKEYYCKSLGEGQKSCYPVCFISIEIPTTDIDINYEPNKTAVLLHNMDIINEPLSKLLSSFYDTDANIDTKGHSKTDSPMPAANKEADSNIADKEIGTSTFQLNAVGLPNKKPKKNLVLSRKGDFQSPSSKKIKFSKNHNDIYRHINTLELFFSSENKSIDDSNTKSTDLCIEQSSRNGINSENSSISNENISMMVTVQRKDVPLDKSSNENASVIVLNKCNEISKDSCSVTSVNSGSNQTESLELSEISEDSFISMMHKESNKKLQKTDERLKNFDKIDLLELQKSKSNALNTFTAGDWSRGLCPAQNVQPVAVLKPKVVRTDASKNEDRSDVEQIDLQEPCVVSVFERKITPFDFFCRKHRFEVLNPKLNNQQIAQILTEKWNRLSPEEKAVYKNMLSKDSPKNIENKKKLGKIGENVNKIKNNLANSKKVAQKKRFKRREESISFEMQLLQECNSDLEEEPNETFRVISCLYPGIWICCQQNKLYLLNCCRLQEAIIYSRLLETYEFEVEQLESSIILTSRSLGNCALDVILQMEVVNEYGSEYISDKRITANGFKLKILRETTPSSKFIFQR